MHYLYKLRICHCALWPENIFMLNRNTPKVCWKISDFLCCKSEDYDKYERPNLKILIENMSIEAL